jgi:DNA replication licensing factor MCM7
MKDFQDCFHFLFSVPNVTDKIYNLIRELAGSAKTVRMSDITERFTTKGYQPDQIDTCIEQYEELNVWQVNQTLRPISYLPTTRYHSFTSR